MSARWTMADVVAARQRMELLDDMTKTAMRNSSFIRPSNDPKPSKFGNRKTNGYASKREAKRAEVLKTWERLGEITDLREQVKFELIPKQDGERACSYFADFVYVNKHGFRVVEDAKGYRDPVYRIKRKLMLKVHGIRIREV